MYNDLYVRENFDDTGNIPSTGIPYQSPDIIPCHDKALTWNEANTSYTGPDIGKSIVNGGINNIYVRSRNLNTAAGAGKVNLYYSKASLFLLPQTWTQIESAGKEKSLSFIDGKSNTSISPNGVAISNPAFLLTGLPPISNSHYCLIAVVQTTAHPITIPSSFPSNAAYDRWAQENPAVSFRNISYSPNTLTQLSRVFRFGNINRNDAYFTIIITGRGFVPGTTITSQCTDKTCPIDQDGVLPKSDSQGNQTISFVTHVPANFWGDLVVTATSSGGKFPTGASLTISYYQIPDTSDALDMAVARRFVTASAGGMGEDSDFKTAMLLKIGECTIRITDNMQLAE